MRHLVFFFLIFASSLAISSDANGAESCFNFFVEPLSLSQNGKIELQALGTFQFANEDALVDSVLGISVWNKDVLEAWQTDVAKNANEPEMYIIQQSIGIQPPTIAISEWVIDALQERHQTFIKATMAAQARYNRYSASYYTTLTAPMRSLLNLNEPDLQNWHHFELNENTPVAVSEVFYNHLQKSREGSLQFPVNFYRNENGQGEFTWPPYNIGNEAHQIWIYHSLFRTTEVEARLRWLMELNPELPFQFLKEQEQQQLIIFFAAFPELTDTVRVWPKLGFAPAKFEFTSDTSLPQSATHDLILGRYPKRFEGFLTASHQLVGGAEHTSFILTVKKTAKNHTSKMFNRNEERALTKNLMDAWQTFAAKAGLAPQGFALKIEFLENEAQITVEGIATATERYATLAEFFVSISAE